MSNQAPQTAAPWQPPANYIEMPSKLEGVTIWGPRPADTSLRAQVTYTCPQCGAATAYDVAAGGVACEHCGYVAPVRAQVVGEAAAQSEFTLTAIKQSEQGVQLPRRELHCQSCGAAQTLPEGEITAVCPFCGSTQVNVAPAASAQMQPNFLVPFSIQPQAAQAGLKKWLGQGWYCPKELSSGSAVEHFSGVYLPFWTFGADIQASWRAEVGHTRTTGTGKNARTYIAWSWKDGQVHLNVEDLLVSGSTHVSGVILGRIQPFNLGGLVAYTADFLAGWQAHAYDISLKSAWETGKDIMREQAKKDCYSDINSSHVRNFSMMADFENETWRYILLPVYVASYQFEGKTFQVIVNGQSGRVAGQKPVAWWKVWLAALALLLPGLGLGAAGLINSGAAPESRISVLLLAGIVLLAVGIALAVVLFRQAMSSEAA